MQEIEALDYKELYLQSKQDNALLMEKIEQLLLSQEKLQHRLDQVLKMAFGSKSERYLGKEQVPTQLRLGLEEEALVEFSVVESRKAVETKPKEPVVVKKKHFVIPESLVDEIQEIHPDNIPEGSKCIGSEVSYRLKGNPTRLSAKKIIRYKYLLPTLAGDPGLQNTIIIAPLPNGVIKNCMADASLLATLVVEKYCDHLPIHRQMVRFDRAGIKLAHSTLLDWTSKTCTLLQPLYESLKKLILQSNYLMMDETTMKVMDKNKKGTTHKGYYWAMQAPPLNLMLFEYHPGRGKEIPKSMIENFKGYFQSDGYSAYESLGNDKDIKLLCCAAHARRYFLEAEKNDPERSKYAMSVFGKLYDIEREIKNKTPEERQRIRQQQAAPIWNDFGVWLQENIGLLKEKSAIYKAFAYTMKRFKRLSVYMENPILNIDNNPIESSIRPIALGRRNYMFSGSHEGAQRSAMFYSFMGSCKLHHVNPMEWLVDVLEKINTHPHEQIHELLPHLWKESSQLDCTEKLEDSARITA